MSVTILAQASIVDIEHFVSIFLLRYPNSSTGVCTCNFFNLQATVAASPKASQPAMPAVPEEGDPSMQSAPTFFRVNFRRMRAAFLGLPSDDEDLHDVQDATMAPEETGATQDETGATEDSDQVAATACSGCHHGQFSGQVCSSLR